MSATSTTPHTTETSSVVPPPWNLVGSGAILLTRPPKDAPRRGLLGGGGALVFVDYAESGVDPYLELLHVPHLTHSRGTMGLTIDRIWVTSPRSVISGRANWGIPKDLAQITKERGSDGSVRWEAYRDGELLAAATLQSHGATFPVVKPRWIGSLLQRMDGRRYATPIDATGKARRANVTSLELGPGFADVAPMQISSAFEIASFQGCFHEAEID